VNAEPAPRRVVTGHTDTGVAKVLTDAVLPTAKQGQAGSRVFHVWNTDTMPSDIALGEAPQDMGALPHITPPPADGTRCVIIDYPAGNAGAMHRTETLDYVIVLAGEIDMELDDSTVHLRAGDVMVQRGTYHAWWNRGTVTCRIAFVLVDAVPLGIGHPRTRENPQGH
jgi:quercetin dioxygenase-like cupin family protein